MNAQIINDGKSFDCKPFRIETKTIIQQMRAARFSLTNQRIFSSVHTYSSYVVEDYSATSLVGSARLDRILRLPITIYVAETGTLRSQETQALDIFKMRCLWVALELLERQTKCDTARSEKSLSPLNQYQMSSDIEDSSGLDKSVVRQPNAN